MQGVMSYLLMTSILGRFLVVFILVLSALSLGNSCFAGNTPHSISAKLFWAAKLMETHKDWTKVSELLREVLEDRTANDFVRSRVEQVKQYVDREPIRRKLQERLETHSFLEARLLLVECLQELRPRLNRSWDGEVRLAQNLIRSVVFPGDEDLGEIIFPAPSSYAFDLYGYTIQNIKSTLIKPAGEKFEALFPEFLSEQKQIAQAPLLKEVSRDLGNAMTITRLSALRDRMRSYLLSEGIKPDVMPSDWNPQRDGSGNDDIKFGQGSDTQQVVSAVVTAYNYVKDVVDGLKNKRTLDEYEPLTLMMVALANPKLIDEDPQLKAFVSGLKLRYRLAIDGEDGVKFEAHDYELVELVNDALSPSSRTRLRLEVDGGTGRTALWLISSFNGDTESFLPELLTFKNIVRSVQTVRYLMPAAAVEWIKGAPKNLPQFPGALGTWITRLTKSDNVIYKVVGTPLKVAYDLSFGRKFVTKGAERTSLLVEKVLARPSLQKAYSFVKTDTFLKIAVGVTAACDLAEGIIKYAANDNSDNNSKIVIHTGSEVFADLVYLTKYKRVVRGALILDIGHIFLDDVPSTAQVLEKAGTLLWGGITKVSTGHTPDELSIIKIKKLLQIGDDNTEALTLLDRFENSVEAAQSLEDLELARAELHRAVGLFAARRLTLHYAMLSTLNSQTNRELGRELERQFLTYENMMNGLWFKTPTHSASDGQPGLRYLRRLYDKKWVALGGTLPRKPKAFEAK